MRVSEPRVIVTNTAPFLFRKSIITADRTEHHLQEQQSAANCR